jgi:hypothetical protein
MATTHGHGSSRDPTYSKYQAMRQRCENPKHIAYVNYGGRGIKVCERWAKFENFLTDMGVCPGENYTIEKIDNSKDYSPDNCKWLLKSEQNRNTRRTISVELDGVRYQTLKDACEGVGIDYHTVRVRVFTYKWSVERALTTPIDKSKRKKSLGVSV